MKNLLDQFELEVTCPMCLKVSKQKIARIKTNRHISCASCNGLISLDTEQFRSKIAEVEVEISKALKGIR